MSFSSKIWKKAVSLGLSFSLAASSLLWVGNADVKASVIEQGKEQEVTLQSVREAAAASYAGDTKTGFDIDLKQTFSGSGGLDYSSDANGRSYMEAWNNLRTGKDDQTVVFRFKTSSENGLLFGIGTDALDNGKNMVLGLKGGKLRAIIRNMGSSGSPDTGLKGDFSSGLSDGRYHTVAISFLPSKGFASDNVRIVIDGGSELYGGLGWGTTRKAGFNQGEDVYTKFEIAGGFYAYADVCNGQAFNGELDFLTVLNRAYTVKELQTITAGDKSYKDFSPMFAAGTCNTWLFTGGTEAVADFSQSKTTRNWIGLFESSFRESGTFVERGRFVFNTAKRGADVAQILEEYDVRIAPFGTTVAGIMIGAADYRKGPDGVEAFQESLGLLIDRIKQDAKIPLILTPYPSSNSSDTANIALYTEAINETVQNEIKVVDLSGIREENVKSDNSLTPQGHQEVANAIKDAVGRSGARTSFGFNLLSDGSYTIAKKTNENGLAKVSEVTALEDGITVKVDAASVSGKQARLEYTLTDSAGEVSESDVSAGETEFTVQGLKRGETYTLNVYDASRGDVRESYQPVEIMVVDGEKGVSLDYPEENVSGNQKIQELFTGERPVTYLFMGDSITHGVVTQGYDNVPQMFAKYLDEIGRSDDIVLNTGVTNATIATTLNQIEPRLMRYQPDIVMIMLGTNDVSYNGENQVTNGVAQKMGITAEQYKERYKELVRKVNETNEDASIVLRVPCEMILPEGDAHTGYEEKFAQIYEVASDMKKEIPGLNIVVVDHRQEWLDYQANVRNDNIMHINQNPYGWLASGDNVHPNGRGNISMFQQLIRELGLYVNTSEIANFQYSLNEWTDASGMGAPVILRGSRAEFEMNHLSGYANGLKNVTLTLSADGRSVSKTENYEESGVISLKGLDAKKTYTAIVTGKDAGNSKEISFQAALRESADNQATAKEKEELQDSLEAAQLPDESIYPPEVLKAFHDVMDEAAAAMEEEALTTVRLDEMLAKVKVARKKIETDALAAHTQAWEKLQQAINETEQTYRKDMEAYRHLPGWSNYEKAYRNAKDADENTATAVLKELAGSLKAAEQTLSEEKQKEDEKKDDDKADQKPQTNPGTQSPSAEQAVEGKTYASGSYRYKVTSISKGTAELIGFADNVSLKKVVVDKEVTLFNKAYKITSVAKSAFEGNRTITDAVIGVSVESIGDLAFSKCTKLKSVKINGKNFKTIGAKAFFNSKKLKELVIKSTALKKVGKNAFKGTAAKLKIKVPKAKYKKYVRILSKKGQSKKASIKK